MSAEEFKYFLTYTYTDSEFVLQLVKELRAAGANVWLDQLDILGGQHWDCAVEEALKICKGMIAVLSPEAVASNNVMDEVSYALDEGKLVVPVILRSCEIPLRLRRVHYIDFTADYKIGFSQLLKALYIKSPAQPLEQPASTDAVFSSDNPPPDTTPAKSLIDEEQATQQTERPPEEIQATDASKTKKDRQMPTINQKRIKNLPQRDKEVSSKGKFKNSELKKLKTGKVGYKRYTTKVLAAVSVVTLITAILIIGFLYKGSDSQLKAGDIKTNIIGMNLVYIPAGVFMMGDTSSAEDLVKEFGSNVQQYEHEFPRHAVKISNSFWMGQTEVTQGQYFSVMNKRPWLGKEFGIINGDAPAIYVSWDDATEFCRKLSEMEGKTYRLPTEAEWEYACRAGTTTRFSFGDKGWLLHEYAWYNYDSRKGVKIFAHPVKQKKPNPWGLYDIHGNVWEWCSDWYKSDYYAESPHDNPKGPVSGITRIIRGGSAGLFQTHARCSFRDHRDPTDPTYSVGFRVVLTQQ
jgi:formylglycine-generating enzyme required for sulfatase activity